MTPPGKSLHPCPTADPLHSPSSSISSGKSIKRLSSFSPSSVTRFLGRLCQTDGRRARLPPAPVFPPTPRPPPSISPCSFSLTGNFPVLICLQWRFARTAARRLSVSLLLELFQSSSAAKLFLLRTQTQPDSTASRGAFSFGANCELGHQQHTRALSLRSNRYRGFLRYAITGSSERNGCQPRPNTPSQSHRTSCCFLPLIAHLSFPLPSRPRPPSPRTSERLSMAHTRTHLFT